MTTQDVPHRTDVLNAFRPNSEIDRPSVFAGRRRQVLALLDSICMEGSCPIIYGERGLGKSSLARQAARIAVGDVELLEDFGVPERALREEDRFTVFWVSCSDSTNSKDDILQCVINQAEGYASLDAFARRNAKEVTTKDSINLRFIKSETQKTFSTRSFQRLNVEEQLLAIVDTLREMGHSRLLFIIDEIDRSEKTRGLASFIKNVSDENMKFMLVGIAHNISSLLADHESLQRHIVPVLVPTMAHDEAEEIVTKTTRQLKEKSIDISFSADATKLLVNAARGFPWFIHVLGQESLVATWDDARSMVSTQDVSAAIASLAANRFAQEFSDRYTLAVGDSIQRELLLRVMAKWNALDVPTSEIYGRAKKVGVTNPYTYKKDLEKKRYGAIIVTQQKGVVRFKNAMFKRYIDLRGSIYQDVKERADKIWDS